jgi:hypothetical protein
MQSAAHSLKGKSDQDLITELRRLAQRESELTAELLVYLGEVDARRLYLAHAAPSMFAFCVRELKLSEDSAYKRIHAARAARRFPVIFALVAQVALHLSAVVLLAPHLTDENHRELCLAAPGLSKRQVEELLASRFPLPAVTTSLRKLPEPRAATPVLAPQPAMSGSSMIAATTVPLSRYERGDSTVASRCLPSGPLDDCRSLAGTQAPLALGANTSSDAAVEEQAAGASLQASSRHLERDRPVLAPLGDERYRLQLTLRRQTRDKLLRAKELFGHKLPQGDLGDVVDAALSLLCETLERRKFGTLKNRKRALSGAEGPAVTAVGAFAGGIAGQAGRKDTQPAPPSETAIEPATATGPHPKPDGAGPRAPVHEPPKPDNDLSPAAACARIRNRDATDLEHAPERVPKRRPLAREPPGACASGEPAFGRQPVDSARSRYISRSVRRAVAERDGQQCTFVSSEGKRCPSRTRLEFHHLEPHARGGPATVSNVTLRCKAHHSEQTDRDFGAVFVAARGRPGEGPASPECLLHP